MKTTITHGPEFYRFLSFDDWSAHGHMVFRGHQGGPGYVVHVDSRGRICTRGTHYTRARDEGAFPIVVYRVDEE